MSSSEGKSQKRQGKEDEEEEQQQRPPPPQSYEPPRIYDAPQLDAEEAETAVLEAIESQDRQRQRRRRRQERQQHPLLVGTAKEIEEDAAEKDDVLASADKQKRPVDKFRSGVKQVIMNERLKNAFSLTSSQQKSKKSHKRNPSRSLDILLQTESTSHSSRRRDSLIMNKDLYDHPHPHHILYPTQPQDVLFQKEFGEEENDDLTTTYDGEEDDEQQQLPMTAVSGQPTEYGTVESAPLLLPSEQPSSSPSFTSVITSIRVKLKRAFRHSYRRLRTARRFFWACLLHSYLMFLAIPLTIAAAILYYGFGNPAPDFLPGKATLAWWCNFAARQIVTFELARLLQFLLVDCILLRIRAIKDMLGSFVILLLMQTRGWPCIFMFWSVIDLFILHGDDPFSTHWLYWTGWKVYSEEANSGAYIIDSTEYLKLLISILLAGMATTVKRTWLAVAFGRRLFAIFKPKMELLLGNVVLLSEIATLATCADTIQAEAGDGGDVDISDVKEITERKGGLNRTNVVKWSSLEVPGSEDESSSIEDDSTDKVKQTDTDDQDVRSDLSLSRTSSGSFHIKQILDRWEEPKTKDDTIAQVSIDDILRFRQALDMMDETYPFGDDFGRASDRDECIQSAHSIYYKLLKVSSSKYTLSFSVFEFLCSDDEDRNKMKMLRKLFRPGRDESLDLFAFVQSVDSLYRRLRYFRASVTNAGSLDRTLENMFNVLFYFVLGLMLLSFMNFNPWSVLVSITSLLVSFSFAFGSTVSKYVQGILLIAVTRPFDLGDRIYLDSASSPHTGMENAGNGWLVEDISLSATKLRYAKTNEVAYLANNLISDMRIYNANRSPNATVMLELILGITVLEGNNLESFRNAMILYVKEHPRMWDSMNFIRIEKIDADNEQVYFTLSFRHRNSWQDAPRIKMHREDLIHNIYKAADQLKINFDSAPARRVLYIAGALENGAVERYKTKLLRPSNIRSRSESMLLGNAMAGFHSSPESDFEAKKSV